MLKEVPNQCGRASLRTAGARFGDHDGHSIAAMEVLHHGGKARAVLLDCPGGRFAALVDKKLLGGPLRVEVEAHHVDRNGAPRYALQALDPPSRCPQPIEERVLRGDLAGDEVEDDEAFEDDSARPAPRGRGRRSW